MAITANWTNMWEYIGCGLAHLSWSLPSRAQNFGPASYRAPASFFIKIQFIGRNKGFLGCDGHHSQLDKYVGIY